MTIIGSGQGRKTKKLSNELKIDRKLTQNIACRTKNIKFKNNFEFTRKDCQTY